jgi:hypothetical protein
MSGQKFNAIVFNDTLANAGTLYMQINAPATGIIKINSITGLATDVCLMTLLEAPTEITDGTAAIVPLNRFRANAAYKPGTLVLFSNPTAITGGGVIERQILGAGGGQGVTVLLEGDPLVLAQNTKYVLKIENNSGSSVQAQIRLAWSEEV